MTGEPIDFRARLVRRMTSDPVDLRDRRLRRNCDRLSQLGGRVIFEFLVELGATRMCRTEIEALLRRYARLDPALLDRLGIER
jgi:hypothetical protein